MITIKAIGKGTPNRTKPNNRSLGWVVVTTKAPMITTIEKRIDWRRPYKTPSWYKKIPSVSGPTTGKVRGIRVSIGVRGY